MDLSSDWTTNISSPAFTIESSICTSPLYRKEGFLRQKYVEEGLSARQIAFLIGCSHHAVNQALKRFGLVREPSTKGRFGFEVRRGPNGRIVPNKLKALVRWMAKLHESGASYREIARRLEVRGVKTPAGGTTWYGCTVRSILLRNRPK